jgi:hypothetical protein
LYHNENPQSLCNAFCLFIHIATFHYVCVLLQITKEKFRASKCELEVMFDVTVPTTAVAAAAEVQSCAAPAADVIKLLQSSVPRHGTAATGNSADCDNVAASSSSDGAAVDAGTATNGQVCVTL